MKFYGFRYDRKYQNIPSRDGDKKPNIYGNITIRKFTKRLAHKAARLFWKRNIWEGW